MFSKHRILLKKVLTSPSNSGLLKLSNGRIHLKAQLKHRKIFCFPDGSDHLIYTEEHLELQKPLLKFIEGHINPHVDEWEDKCRFPARSLFHDLGKFGIFGVDKSIEYGGLGLDFSYHVALAEAIGEIECGAIPMACAVQSSMATPALVYFGSEKLKSEFLVPSISGERIACIGVSESCAGSDVAGIRTVAHFNKGDLIINGSKCWITNGHQADWICLLANTTGATGSCNVAKDFNESDPHRNKSLICVKMSEPGIKLGKPIEKLGMRCSDTAEIFFDNVRVPASNIIGLAGRGFYYQMRQFQNERLIGCAMVTTPLDRILRLTTEYALQRQMFGERAYNCNQSIRYTLAELATELESLRTLLYRAVLAQVRVDRNLKAAYSESTELTKHTDLATLSSMVKFKTGRLARRLTDECLQVWGGNGYVWESAIARAFRDFRLYSIGGGCDEVMLSIIAQHLKAGSFETKS